MGLRDRISPLAGLLLAAALSTCAWTAGAAPSSVVVQSASATDALEPAKAAIRVKDYAAAADLLSQQAARDNADAQYLLGTMVLADLVPGADQRAGTPTVRVRRRAGTAACCLCACGDACDERPAGSRGREALAGAGRGTWRSGGGRHAAARRPAARGSPAGLSRGRGLAAGCPMEGCETRRRRDARGARDSGARECDRRIRPDCAAPRSGRRRRGGGRTAARSQCKSRRGRCLWHYAADAGVWR